MLGQPKFKYGDQVTFVIDFEEKTYEVHGTIYIVDSYGTFEQSEEPSYDILAKVKEEPFDGEEVLFKHVRESGVRKDEE